MNPALSVILFTVISGIGYGFFIVLTVTYMFSQWQGDIYIEGSIFALILITLGLLSSTLHLANRKNAWRAMFRIRTSWLAREGALAILFYPIALAYIALGYEGGVAPDGWLWVVVSVLVLMMALATVFSTGMIYACLKTIRQWNTPLVPANYLLLATMHGLLLFLAIQSMGYDSYLHTDTYSGQVIANLCKLGLAMLAICFLMKAIYYAWITQPKGSTINTATGFTGATVRLLDVGHTAGNFLTEEFGYQLADKKRTVLRILVFILSFIIPAWLLAYVLAGEYKTIYVTYALIISVIGVLIERWLFFAEAKHVVNLYHGQPHT